MMDSKTFALTLAGLVVGVQVGLFAWLKADIADVASRVDRLEREVAYVRGQLSTVLPLAQVTARGTGSPANPPPSPNP